MNTITEAEQFYGYLIGLQVERCPNLGPDTRAGEKLYATFEYGEKVSVWEVPDAELFSTLASHLCDMAKLRSEFGDYGYSKLWIKKANGQWRVDLP